jgi:phospholipid/cholesterol/gamma-HCH transport system substrate-binding protein
MKSKNWSAYFIALAVIGCSLVLLATLTIALTGYHWGGRGRTIEVEFADATGIKLHSAARYAGAVAGTVVGMRYLQPTERIRTGTNNLAVRITVRLNEDVPPLPSDTQATISSETILGEKFVALSAGSPGAKPLNNGAVIQGQSLSGIETLTASFEKTAAAATELLQKFNADYPALRQDIGRLLTNGDAFLSAGNRLAGEAELAVKDVRGTLKRLDTAVADIAPGASDLMGEAKAAVTNLNQSLDRARLITTHVQQFLTNQFLANLDQNMKNMTSVVARLDLLSEYGKILTANLAAKPSRLIWQTRVNKLPSEEDIRQHKSPAPTPKKSP